MGPISGIKPPALLAFATLLAAVAPTGAALAPNWQRAAEMKAILESAEIAAALKERPIDRIEALGVDRYRVTAGRCRLEVAITGLPQAMPGARPFRLAPGPVRCR